jgi:hypothetical protein
VSQIHILENNLHIVDRPEETAVEHEPFSIPNLYTHLLTYPFLSYNPPSSYNDRAGLPLAGIRPGRPFNTFPINLIWISIIVDPAFPLKDNQTPKK